jgi:hypothetical protein
MSRLYASIADGMEDVLGNLPILDQLSLASANIIAAATNQSQPPKADENVSAIAEAEAELNAFEDNKEAEPFVKPVCDLFLEVFELNRKSNWLRGRAVVVVLHQLLGGTIEKFVFVFCSVQHQPPRLMNGVLGKSASRQRPCWMRRQCWDTSSDWRMRYGLRVRLSAAEVRRHAHRRRNRRREPRPRSCWQA